MYIKVAYWKPSINAYASWEYTYSTELPVKVGSKVIADTATSGKQKAIVTEINVPESEISDHWRNRIKAITEYDTEPKIMIRGGNLIGNSGI